MRNDEIDEAIAAGMRAMESLNRAEIKLNSAGNWGILDIFSGADSLGGKIGGVLKHKNIAEARVEMENAKRDLMSFAKELRDAQETFDLGVDVGNFLMFADFFFDGLIADIMVQKKISQAKEQIVEAKRQVKVMLQRLDILKRRG